MPKRITKRISPTVLLDEKSLAVWPFANNRGEGPKRYDLERVHVAPDGTTAGTDGRAVALVSPCGVDPDDAPELGPAGKTPALVGVGLAKPLRSALRKMPSHARPGMTVAKITTDGVVSTVMTVPVETVGDDNVYAYPDVEDLARSYEAQAVENGGRTVLSVETLARVAKLAKDVGATCVDIRVSSPVSSAPTLFRARSKDGREVLVVAAPVRVQKRDGNLSPWECRVLGIAK